MNAYELGNIMNTFSEDTTSRLIEVCMVCPGCGYNWVYWDSDEIDYKDSYSTGFTCYMVKEDHTDCNTEMVHQTTKQKKLRTLI